MKYGDRRDTHKVGFCHRFAYGESCVGCGDQENGIALPEYSLTQNYRRCLEREKVYLEVIDDLMIAMATDSRMKMNQAYKRSALRIAASKDAGLIAK